MNLMKKNRLYLPVLALALLMALLSFPAATGAEAVDVAASWDSAFSKYGVQRVDLENYLGKPLEKMSKSDSGRLQRILDAAKSGDNAKRLLAIRATIDTLPIGPQEAVKLAEQVNLTEARFHEILKELETDIAQLPENFPPDLHNETLIIDKYLDLVRALKKSADNFELRSPDMMDAAVRHRNALRSAIDELAKGAETDRAEASDGFGDLAAAEAIISQSYDRRLEWADRMIRDIQSQLAKVKSSKKLLTRWESVLQLMRPIVEDGKFTKESREQLLAYFRTIDTAVKSFRDFAEKVRRTSDSNYPIPAENAKPDMAPMP